MNYVPLFGRWATLLLVVAIAVGAAALSFSLDGMLHSAPVVSPETASRVAVAKNPWAAGDSASTRASAPGQIIIVNPDGSPAGASTNVEGGDGSMSGAPSDDFGWNGATSNGSANPTLPTGRIE